MLTFPSIIETEAPRSELPAGGSPADDRAYGDWRGDLLNQAYDRHLLRHWHNALDVPFPWPSWRFDAALIDALEGRIFRDPMIASHRLRALAVAFKYRRRKVEALAREILSWL